MAVHRAPHLRVAGELEIGGGAVTERAGVVVGEHAPVRAGPLDEVDPLGRGQTDQLGALAPADQKRGRERRLRRGARDDDRLRPGETVVGELVVEQERGPEQRSQQHLLVLVALLVTRVGVGEGVVVVDGRQLCPVRGDVGEAVLADAVGPDHEVGRGREVPVHPPAGREPVVLGGGDVGKAPDRDPPPPGLGREEVPVVHRVAEDGVGDVVGGQAEARDLEQRFTLSGLRWLTLDEAGRVQIFPADLEVDGETLDD
jgi:hypothetical protein